MAEESGKGKGKRLAEEEGNVERLLFYFDTI